MSSFDPELGPGALGFGDDSLFAFQVLQSNYTILGVLDIEAKHYFDKARLLHKSWIESAQKRGKSKAYISYHWRHQSLSKPIYNLILSSLRLYYWRIRNVKDITVEEGCIGWEMLLVKKLYFWNQDLNRAQTIKKL